MTATKLEEAYRTVRNAEKKALEEAREKLVKLREDIGTPLADALKVLPLTVPGPRSAVHTMLTGFEAAISNWPGQIEQQIAQIDAQLAHYNGYGDDGDGPSPIG